MSYEVLFPVRSSCLKPDPQTRKVLANELGQRGTLLPMWFLLGSSGKPRMERAWTPDMALSVLDEHRPCRSEWMWRLLAGRVCLRLYQRGPGLWSSVKDRCASSPWWARLQPRLHLPREPPGRGLAFPAGLQGSEQAPGAGRCRARHSLWCSCNAVVTLCPVQQDSQLGLRPT